MSSVARPHRPQTDMPVNRYLLTVVIPTFRRPHIVRDVVKSVLGQRERIQVVVVDDGSEENMRPDLGGMSRHEDLSLIQLEENRGATNARNVGAAEAKGVYLAFLDSDDYVQPGWAETLFKMLEAPDVRMASCAAEHCEFDDLGNPLRHTFPSRAGWCPEIGRTSIHRTGAWIVRRDDFESVGGYDINARSMQHTELALRLFPHIRSKGGRASSTDQVLMTRRFGAADRIRRDDLAVLEGNLYLVAKHQQTFEQFPRWRADLLSTAAVRAARIGRMHQARALLRQAVRHQPCSWMRWARIMAAYGPVSLRRRWFIEP